MSTKDDAQEAVFKAVIEVCNAAQNAGVTTKSTMVRDAAYAYRAAAGGNQPGQVVTSD
jgi:hypothetical protein